MKFSFEKVNYLIESDWEMNETTIRIVASCPSSDTTILMKRTQFLVWWGTTTHTCIDT